MTADAEPFLSSRFIRVSRQTHSELAAHSTPCAYDVTDRASPATFSLGVVLRCARIGRRVVLCGELTLPVEAADSGGRRPGGGRPQQRLKLFAFEEAHQRPDPLLELADELGVRSSLATRGVQFSFNDAVQRLQIEQGAIRAVHSSSGVHACSKLVVAAAGWSPKLLAGSGVRVWIKPVKGYSVTVPLEDASLMPGRSIIDNEMHAAVTPLARRLRLAGTAEFAGWNPTLDPARIKNLWNMLESVNPALAQAVDRGAARNWCGFRPMSADGNPYIGATRIKGLYLNSGHGYLGWTQSAGSGALLTQQLGGAEPEIDDQPYRVARG